MKLTPVFLLEQGEGQAVLVVRPLPPKKLEGDEPHPVGYPYGFGMAQVEFETLGALAGVPPKA